MRKVFNKIHLWLSIPFGIIITLICFSGAMLVFENEIMELVRKDTYKVEQVLSEKVPTHILIENVAKTLPEDVQVTGLTISSDPQRAYQVNISKPRRASIYINQYTGEVHGLNERAKFFTFMLRLHRWLLGSSQPKTEGGVAWGKTIVGISTIMFVFVLVSGIVIWWPRTIKALKNRVSIVTHKGLKRFWYDLHVSAGFWATLLLLVMALTGLTWSFPWYRTAFYKVFGVETAQQAPPQPNQQPSGEKPQHGAEAGNGGGRNTETETDGQVRRSPYAMWQTVADNLAAENKGFDKISINQRGASVSYKSWGNQRATDSYKFNPRSGEIMEATLYKDTEKAGKMRGWIYTVHVGSWGGLFSKILTFLAALIGASLPITGYYLWIKRLARKRSSAKKI